MTFAEAEECEARHIAEASTNAAMRGESLDACRSSECGHSPNTASHECVKHMPTAVERLPDELLLMIFEMLSRDTKTLMTVVPAVCRRWRAVYVHTRNVHLDFDSALSLKLVCVCVQGIWEQGCSAKSSSEWCMWLC